MGDQHSNVYVPKFVIFGPIDNFRDIENLVSFERAFLNDNLKYEINIYLLFLYISPLGNTGKKNNINGVYVKY